MCFFNSLEICKKIRIKHFFSIDFIRIYLLLLRKIKAWKVICKKKQA